ncbi:MAG: hypothetical protein KIG81_01755, partial [Thermoguttaceae bacterium]|nr:hypothetical protein [Thermoguttaceae bacterium]
TNSKRVEPIIGVKTLNDVLPGYFSSLRVDKHLLGLFLFLEILKIFLSVYCFGSGDRLYFCYDVRYLIQRGDGYEISGYP